MSDKVVSLAKKKQELEDKKTEETPVESPTASETDFEAIAKANAEKAEKLKKERLNANKSVLRSYRIKN